jgi:hypothetical protein
MTWKRFGQGVVAGVAAFVVGFLILSILYAIDTLPDILVLSASIFVAQWVSKPRGFRQISAITLTTFLLDYVAVIPAALTVCSLGIGQCLA